MRVARKLGLAATLLAAATAAPEVAWGRPQVMILGSYEVADAKPEVGQTDGDGHENDARLALVRALGRWRPTRIAVESDLPRGGRDREYADFLNGRDGPAAEALAIGFHLARDGGHRDVCVLDVPRDGAARVTPADPQPGPPPRDGFEPTSQAPIAQNAPHAEPRLNGWRLVAEQSSPRLAGAWGHPLTLGARRTRLVRWYEGNMRIFAELRSCLRFEGERLLVIVGAGHAQRLRELVRETREIDLVSPTTFLATPPARSLPPEPPAAGPRVVPAALERAHR